LFAAACRWICYIVGLLTLALLRFVVRMLADFCSLCESPLTVTWIDLLFVVLSRFLPCRCNSFLPLEIVLLKILDSCNQFWHDKSNLILNVNSNVPIMHG
jgi:hypothetical protein